MHFQNKKLRSSSISYMCHINMKRDTNITYKFSKQSSQDKSSKFIYRAHLKSNNR